MRQRGAAGRGASRRSLLRRCRAAKAGRWNLSVADAQPAGVQLRTQRSRRSERTVKHSRSRRSTIRTRRFRWREHSGSQFPGARDGHAAEPDGNCAAWDALRDGAGREHLGWTIARIRCLGSGTRSGTGGGIRADPLPIEPMFDRRAPARGHIASERGISPRVCSRRRKRLHRLWETHVAR